MNGEFIASCCCRRDMYDSTCQRLWTPHFYDMYDSATSAMCLNHAICSDYDGKNFKLVAVDT